MLNAPTLCGWKPSTSFAGLIACITLSSLICFGSGSCTSIPSTSSLSFSECTSLRSSSSVVSSGISYASERMPVYSHAFFLFPTYTVDAGSFPTCITARVVSTPFAIYFLLNYNFHKIIVKILPPVRLDNLKIIQLDRFTR